jgi:hypothetical protein
MLELNSVGFVGSVNLSLSNLPAGVTLAQPIPTVGLNVGDQPVNQVVPVGLYVSASVLPGSYQFGVTATPSANSSSLTPVQVSGVLTVTSAVDSPWRAE